MNWYKKALKMEQPIELWLDDNRDPKDPVTQKLFGSKGTEVWVKTVSEAKQHLLESNVISISFDNDLGQTEEGYDLAKWIEERAYHKELPGLNWNIHSKNISASPRIEQAMRNADKYWNL